MILPGLFCSESVWAWSPEKPVELSRTVPGRIRQDMKTREKVPAYCDFFNLGGFIKKKKISKKCLTPEETLKTSLSALLGASVIIQTRLYGFE